MAGIDGVLNSIDSNLWVSFFFYYKINVKKQQCFDRSTVIFKSKDKICSCSYIINCKNANDILTKNLKYLHRNNTGNCDMNE